MQAMASTFESHPCIHIHSLDHRSPRTYAESGGHRQLRELMYLLFPGRVGGVPLRSHLRLPVSIISDHLSSPFLRSASLEALRFHHWEESLGDDWRDLAVKQVEIGLLRKNWKKRKKRKKRNKRNKRKWMRGQYHY